MKRRRLPETEIANLAFLPPSQKLKKLESWLRPRKITRSYEPFRQTLSDAVNVQLPLMPGQDATDWNRLKDRVAKKCGCDETLLTMNLGVVRATHEFATKVEMRTFPFDARPLYFPETDPYDFALPLIVTYGGKARIVFLDLRRTGRLSDFARKVVFSAQHVRLRERYPELSDATLEIWRYKNNDARTIEAINVANGELFSYDELEADFAESYTILNQLLNIGQEHERKAASDPGPLFGAA